LKGKIEPDDLRAGQYIIVTEWYDETVKDDEYDFWGHPIQRPKKQVGLPFKVLAIALPFVTLEALAVGITQGSTRGVFDTRLAALMEVDLRYVRSLMPGYTPSGVRRPTDLTKDERIVVQRYTAKEGWTEIRKEPK
jgi:hypothetical protein